MAGEWIPDAVAFCLPRLQVADPNELTKAGFNLALEVRSVANLLNSRYQVVALAGGPDALGAEDALFWAEGVGKLTAVRLRPSVMRKIATGDIIHVGLVRDEFKFAPDKVDPTIAWAREAAVALGRVTLIQQYYAARADSFDPFVMSGPTRTRKEWGIYETLLSADISLLTDDWSAQLSEYDVADQGDFDAP